MRRGCVEEKDVQGRRHFFRPIVCRKVNGSRKCVTPFNTVGKMHSENGRLRIAIQKKYQAFEDKMINKDTLNQLNKLRSMGWISADVMKR